MEKKDRASSGSTTGSIAFRTKELVLSLVSQHLELCGPYCILKIFTHQYI